MRSGSARGPLAFPTQCWTGGARPGGSRSTSASPSRFCLQEALLRDRANAAPPGPFLVAEAELALWDWAEIEVTRPLRLVDLRGAALARSRVPTDVVGAADHRLARAWAAAFHRHPSGLDGIAFPSRFRTGDNLSLFHNRVAGALRVVSRRHLLDSPVELGRACHTLNLAIVAAAPNPSEPEVE